MGALMESFKQTKGERMSHFTGKVYDLTQENFQKVIAELEEAKESLSIAVEALRKAACSMPHRQGYCTTCDAIEKLAEFK